MDRSVSCARAQRVSFLGKVPLRASVFGCLLASVLAGLVSGCVQSTTQAPPIGSADMRIPRKEGMSPRGASVALASFNGAPAPVADRFQYFFGQAAEKRDIELIDSAKAHYLVRGYLSATPEDGDILVAAVWDIFDSGKQRLQRMKNIRLLKGGVADPWSAITDQTLQDLSTSAAENLAAFLSNMPEAQPMVAQADTGPRSAPMEGRAVGTTPSNQITAGSRFR
ncbi:hypothetical protein [Beijerinckia indica]|uniref:Lipoprotein n=1 Tax=Beijerinckia indica subsp. indica (strain ATCC 9039 / DSM 1715 / NCIMB 8712) TaxID=395963 RepID=B2ICR7_BEII9|nr:hypothetical protein [Beijerinckia indica]ACB95341.1 hypothetical protein Bind_1711 [Beijerinckia indica subsp. indica ATCC 9039]